METNKFKAQISKIFDNLIEEEIKGQKFFYKASKAVKDKILKKLFEKLAVEESYHLDVIESEKKKVEKYIQKNIFNFDKTDVSSVSNDRNISDFNVPTEIKSRIEKLELFKEEEVEKLLEKSNPKDIISYAIKIEIKNYKYFLELIEIIQDDKLKEIFNELANQEKSHYEWLMFQYKRLKKI